MPRALTLVIAATLALGGCVLHLADDTACGDDVTLPGGGSLVNPASLTCEWFSENGSCPGFVESAPTWGACDSACRALDEATCVNSPGCRGAYDHDCLFGTGPCPAFSPFLGCFPTDLNQDFVTGCAGLDAWNCSRHENCISTHRGGATCRDGLDQDGDGIVDDLDECALEFVRCLPESAPV